MEWGWSIAEEVRVGVVGNGGRGRGVVQILQDTSRVCSVMGQRSYRKCVRSCQPVGVLHALSIASMSLLGNGWALSKFRYIRLALGGWVWAVNFLAQDMCCRS